MPRIRAAAIIIKDDEVLLMHRRKKSREYFTFPGGGAEPGETIQEAILREVKEETSVEISIQQLLYHQFYDDGSEQYFYLCSWLSGTPELSSGSEEIKDLDNNFYQPLWVKQGVANEILLYPLEIRDDFFQDQKDNFKNCPKETQIKISELRH